MTITRTIWFFGIILLATGFTKAFADGAVAFGTTGNLAQDGFALGYATNSATIEEAKAVALKHCFEFQGAPKKTTANCKLVATLKNECLAINFDPEVGNPGVGWGIGPDKASAEGRALAGCHTTAGKSRTQFCRHNRTVCDGTAK